MIKREVFKLNFKRSQCCWGDVYMMKWTDKLISGNDTWCEVCESMCESELHWFSRPGYERFEKVRKPKWMILSHRWSKAKRWRVFKHKVEVGKIRHD